MDEERILGCILGTAVGDSVGLPYEGLSRSRAMRLLGHPDRQRLLFGRGMISDDTEHTLIVARALAFSRGDLQKFQSELASGLKRWLLCLPAGVGLATLRAVIRLLLGIVPEHSGVFSAGNGPAMRAAILGVLVSESDLRKYVRVSSRITHTDPKAELGAYAVALAAQMASRNRIVSPDFYLDQLKSHIGDEDPLLIEMMTRVVSSVSLRQTTVDFAAESGLANGVSGYIYHSVPVAIHAWLSHQKNCREAIVEVIRCGGDTDTTGAIVGGIVGAGVGRSGIPQDWISGIMDWPCTILWMENLGRQLGPETSAEPKPLFQSVWWTSLLLRNLLFACVVLCHGVRRLAPPY